MSGGPDFSSVLSGADGGSIVQALVSVAGVLAMVGFAKWGAKKVATFFDEHDGTEWTDTRPCAECGDEWEDSELDGDGLCAGCHADAAREYYD